jgi:hypothetical protein
MVCVDPALATVGGAVTVMATSLVDAVQGALVIVHLRVYTPAPPAGVNDDVLLLIELN